MRPSTLIAILGLVAFGCSGTNSTTSTILSITPPSVTLPPNGLQRFTANRPVSWSIVEADGGSIDASGSYTGPPTPGSYTVAATATDGTGLGATARVTVRPWRLEILAGTLGGAGDADDSGSRARFSQPGQVAFDGNGALYIADSLSNAVRKLDARRGTVTTIAKSQQLAGVCGIALDGNGNLFASTRSGVINRVAIADGSIVTVSGKAYAITSEDGPAADATFFTPCGLSWDSGRRRLYIADRRQGIRVYDQDAARVSTLVSGRGDWAGVAFAGGNDLYASNDSMIARVDVTSGQLTALAYGGGYYSGGGYADGVGSGGHFFGGGQIALDLANNALYVGDRNVRKLDLGTRLVTTVGPRDFAWDGPGIALDGAGGLYVTSSTGNAILHESVTGNERRIVAGLPGASGAAAWVDGIGTAARFAAPSGLAYDGQGALFVADTDNEVVRRVDVASGAVTTLVGTGGGYDRDGVGSAGQLIFPTRAVSDGSGGYLVVESSSHTVRRWNPTSGSVTTLAGVYRMPGIDDGIGKQARFDQPGGICVLGGAAFLADTSSRTLRKIDLATGAVTTVAGSPETMDVSDGIGGAARLYEPIDVACDGLHSVYILESIGAVRRFDTVTARVTTLAHVGNFPSAIAIDDAHAYVTASASGGPLIQRVSLADGTLDTIAAPAQAQVLISLVTDGAGNLYTSNRFGTLYRIAADGTSTTLANPNGYFGAVDGPLATATFGNTIGLSWDNGTLLVAETFAHKLRRIDLQAGVVSTIQGRPGVHWPVSGQGTSALIGKPLGVAVDGGQLYVTCAGFVGIDLANLDVTPLAPNSTTPNISINLPNGIVSDGNGHFYYSDKWLQVVRRLDRDGSIHDLAGDPSKRGSSDGVGSAATFFYPEGVALDGGTLYVADSWNHNIRAVRLSDGNVTTLAGLAGSPGATDGPGGDARFNGPTALATDGNGGLLVADSGNGLIRRIDLRSGGVTTIIGVAGQNGVVTGDLPARLNHPSGIAVLPGGSLAITDEQAILVLR